MSKQTVMLCWFLDCFFFYFYTYHRKWQFLFYPIVTIKKKCGFFLGGGVVIFLLLFLFEIKYTCSITVSNKQWMWLSYLITNLDTNWTMCCYMYMLMHVMYTKTLVMWNASLTVNSLQYCRVSIVLLLDCLLNCIEAYYVLADVFKQFVYILIIPDAYIMNYATQNNDLNRCFQIWSLQISQSSKTSFKTPNVRSIVTLVPEWR